MATLDENKRYVLKKCDDAECVADEDGKWYVREAAEQHEMSGHFDTKEEAWANAREWVGEYL